MDRGRIIGIDEATAAFLEEWQSPSPWIVANTSGSTGAPKPIRLAKEDMRLSARATLAHLGLNRGGMEFVMPLSAGYIAGKMMVVRALEADARLWVLPPSRNPLRRLPGGIVPDLLPIVPAQIEALIEARRPVRNVIVGGAPMSAVQERALTDAGIRAFATYGMTETCSHVAMRHAGDPVFTAMPGITFATDDGSRLVVSNPSAVYGELATNDVVELIDATHFRWLGRADNVIVSGGVKIHPELVEQAVASVMAAHCTAFYVASRPSERWGREAVVIAEGQPVADPASLIQAMRPLLPATHLPKAIIWTSAIPRTSSGKIKRVNADGM